MPQPISAASETFAENRRKVHPKIIDNDRGVITVSVNGRRVRDWIYANDAEQRRMMSEARWYVEGWGDGRDFA